jgi:hypothetical protein
MTQVEVWGILPAIVAAAASIVVALVSLRQTRHTSRDLAELTHSLDEERAESNARRDYIYEARKRLYTECEPLIFQGLELADNAQRRVQSLARSCREEKVLADGSGWLAREDYYLHSSVYSLLAPLTTYKILQRKLTRIDMSVEPDIRTQYEVFRAAFDVFTDDYQLAAIAPQLEYDPERADTECINTEDLAEKHFSVYKKQGYYRGTLDQIIEAMILVEDGNQRCKSFGEFLADLQKTESATGRVERQIRTLLLHFHPLRTPVLWRLLIAQFYLYRYLIAYSGANKRASLPEPSEREFAWLDWGDGNYSASRLQVEAGHWYAAEKLKEIWAKL